MNDHTTWGNFGGGEYSDDENAPNNNTTGFNYNAFNNNAAGFNNYNALTNNNLFNNHNALTYNNLFNNNAAALNNNNVSSSVESNCQRLEIINLNTMLQVFGIGNHEDPRQVLTGATDGTIYQELPVYSISDKDVLPETEESTYTAWVLRPVEGQEKRIPQWKQSEPKKKPVSQMQVEDKTETHFYWTLKDISRERLPLGEEYWAVAIQYEDKLRDDFPVFIKTKSYTIFKDGGLGTKEIQIRDPYGRLYTIRKGMVITQQEGQNSWTEQGAFDPRKLQPGKNVLFRKIAALQIIADEPHPPSTSGNTSYVFKKDENRLREARSVLQNLNVVTVGEGDFAEETPEDRQSPLHAEESNIFDRTPQNGWGQAGGINLENEETLDMTEGQLIASLADREDIEEEVDPMEKDKNTPEEEFQYRFDARRSVFILDVLTKSKLEMLLPLNERYAKLKPIHTKKLGIQTEPKTSIEEIYIPHYVFDRMPGYLNEIAIEERRLRPPIRPTAKVESMKDISYELLLPDPNSFERLWARNDQGRPYCIPIYEKRERGAKKNPIDDSSWQSYLTTAVRSIGAGIPPRDLDPKINLFLSPRGDVTREQLQDWVDVIKELLDNLPRKGNETPKNNQLVSIINRPSTPEELARYHQIGTSPFGHYDTYIDENVYCHYVWQHPSYIYPSIVDRAAEQGAFLQLEADLVQHYRRQAVTRLQTQMHFPTIIRNEVNRLKIATAKGKRKVRGFGDNTNWNQQEVMGCSASDIAKTLGWPEKDGMDRNHELAMEGPSDDEDEDENAKEYKDEDLNDWDLDDLDVVEKLLEQAQNQPPLGDNPNPQLISTDKWGLYKPEDLKSDLSISDAKLALGMTHWPQTPFTPAEWLHRSAYSWGALVGRASNSPQIPQNLVFGSSETNSLMTRFEKSWQSLVTRLGEKLPNMTGTLTVTVTDQVHSKHFADAASFTDLDTWTADSKNEIPWISKAIIYELKINEVDVAKATAGVIQGGPWRTVFYPFQRPFFTRFERELDRYILDLAFPEYLKRRRKGKAVKATADPTKDKRRRMGEDGEEYNKYEPTGEKFWRKEDGDRHENRQNQNETFMGFNEGQRDGFEAGFDAGYEAAGKTDEFDMEDFEWIRKMT